MTDVSFDPVHPLTGPIAVEGATPGDVLEVELLDLQHKGWGYNVFMPGEMGLGLLPEEFPDAGIHVWDLEGDVGHFVNGIEVPLDPFPGVIGVVPRGRRCARHAPAALDGWEHGRETPHREVDAVSPRERRGRAVLDG